MSLLHPLPRQRTSAARLNANSATRTNADLEPRASLDGSQIASEPVMRGRLAFADLTSTIIGAFFATAKELGPGFSERVCQRSLQVALIDEGLTAEIDVPIRVYFRKRRVGRFFADLVVNETVLVEVKAVAAFEGYMEAQILNYLKCAGGGIGLLVNFGRLVEFKRFAVGDPANSLPLLRENRSAAGGLWPPAR